MSRKTCGDLGLVQGFALEQFQRQLVQHVAVLGEDGVSLVMGLVDQAADFLIHNVGDLVRVVALVAGVAAKERLAAALAQADRANTFAHAVLR